jgi:hypothetical protein
LAPSFTPFFILYYNNILNYYKPPLFVYFILGLHTFIFWFFGFFFNFLYQFYFFNIELVKNLVL